MQEWSNRHDFLCVSNAQESFATSCKVNVCYDIQHPRAWLQASKPLARDLIRRGLVELSVKPEHGSMKALCITWPLGKIH